MSQLLYDMIHNKAKETWEGDLKHRYEEWIAHWFTTAENIAIKFENDGLTKTSQAVIDIIVDQKRILKYDNRSR